MSSILKALKKIDEDSPQPETFPALPKMIGGQRAVNSTVTGRRRLVKIASLGLILLIVGAAGFLIFSRNGPFPAGIFSDKSPPSRQAEQIEASENSNVYRAKMPSNSVRSPQLNPAGPLTAEKTPKTIVPKDTVKRFRADTNSPPSTSASRQQKQQTTSDTSVLEMKSPAKFDDQINPSGSLKKNASSQKIPLSKSNVAVDKASDRRGVERKSAVTYDPIEDSKLKLQALAWFTEASRRVAVINGRIVREGESIEGFQITQIRKEDVVVNDGTKSWRLEFRLTP